MPKTKNTQLAKVESSEVTVAKLATVKKIICPDATDEELQLFALHCNQTGLDPFSNQIYLIKRGGKPTFQTSIDGYRIVAERSGSYAGNDDYKYDEAFTSGQEKYPKFATATVYRMVAGVRVPFSATARWNEYKQEYKGQLGNMWSKFPSVMLGKCAEALALRKAFPNALSGVYTQEEMAQADNTPTPQVKEVQEMKVVEEPKEEPTDTGFSEEDLKQLDLIEAIYALSEQLGNDHEKTDEIILTGYKKPLDKLTSEKLLIIHDALTRKVNQNGKQ